MASRVLQELKRRKVVQVAIVYAVAGFAVIQAADVMLPNLGIPSWGVTLVVALVILGFPLALVLSWMFDVTSEGIERTEGKGDEAPSGDTAGAPPDRPAVEREPQVVAPAALQPPRTSIAILPFANMSDSADNEYFSDGITEDILAQTSLIGALQVVSHTSVKRYKGTDKPIAEIARELQVGCVVEGSVRRAGNRVRIVAQLIDAGTDRHLWAETYDRDLTDIFAVQSDVAKKIASALQAQLTEDELERLEARPTESAEAYDLVLKGRAAALHMTRTSLLQALRHFEDALDIQPDYREALTSWNGVMFLLPYFTPSPPDEQAERVAGLSRRLGLLDPTSFEAHFLAGSLEMLSGWDWAKAERELEAAIRLEPRNFWVRIRRCAVGIFLGDVGRTADDMLEACANHPGDANVEEATGALLIQAGRFRDGIDLLEPWIEREPLHLYPPLWAGVAYIVFGEVDRGLGLLERAREVSGGSPAVELVRGTAFGFLGRSAAVSEVGSELLARSQSEYVSEYAIAVAQLFAGEPERAIDHLERALEQREQSVPIIGFSPVWQPLYTNPRFQAVFQQVFPGRTPPTPSA